MQTQIPASVSFEAIDYGSDKKVIINTMSEKLLSIEDARIHSKRLINKWAGNTGYFTAKFDINANNT